MLRILSYISLIYFITFEACAQMTCAQMTSANVNSNEAQSEAFQIMQLNDFNHDGKISKKEYVVCDGNTGYRAHLSNIYKSLNLEKNDNISLQQYWFIEMVNPTKYQTDLKNYFAYMDKDSDGYISTEEYRSSFQGNYISKFGLLYAEMVDADHNQKISFDEYVNFDFTSIDYPSFHSLDFNNDSFVTMDELNELFSYFKKSW